MNRWAHCCRCIRMTINSDQNKSMTKSINDKICKESSKKLVMYTILKMLIIRIMLIEMIIMEKKTVKCCINDDDKDNAEVKEV